ncbi:hypothetical protein JOF56_003621 [Kibdelosporangium banguiense]|uniref:DUF3558 domain-containing protein n=1 Tax=Kibdelosporangium banguiense TaxID=1365924 RepID=A0ABS4TFP4_9PSEU|nr:hypothetical protein [Kibdelosporangium banguiense]MBP2323236.1 hypothetical protein [Kibdelosporangium banguiense]
MSRSARIWLATALVTALAGCAGQVDLSKTVTPRTTVKASGSFEDEALRMVEPCGLLTDQVVDSIGKKRSSSNTNRSGYSECSMTITDKATEKQTINLTIKVGAGLLGAPKQTSKSIRGLGVFETSASSSCTQSAITNKETGITAQVFWEGGDTCGSATKLLESAIRQIAGNPPVYQDTPGSLVKLEPCAAIDDATARTIFGAAASKTPYGIRSCLYQADLTVVALDYTIDSDPYTSNSARGAVRVDVTDKIKGAAQYRSIISQKRCVIEWVHRALSGNRNENVRVAFERTPEDPKEDPCAKTLEAARAVAGKLAKS